jgi:hypothetical protein
VLSLWLTTDFRSSHYHATPHVDDHHSIMWTRGIHLVCESSMEHDQETEIWQVSTVFAQEKSEHGQTKKSRHVQDKSCGEETRTRYSVFQAELGPELLD